MNANIEEYNVVLGDGNAMTLYRVDYAAVQGNGYDTMTIWRTFGVYEKKEVATWVCNAIENGMIFPVRKA